MSNSIRTTVYTNPELWALIQIESPKPNLSKIFNEALAAYLGLEYIHEPDLLKEKTGKMRSRLIEHYREQQKIIEREAIEEHEETTKKILRENIILESCRKLYPTSQKGKLPENDRHGDFTDWWDSEAGKVSNYIQLEVSASELQQAIRRMKA